MRKHVNRAVPNDVKMLVSYTGKKLNTCFNVKNKTVFKILCNMVSAQRNLVNMIM